MSNGNNIGGNEAFNGDSGTRFGQSVESQAQIRDANVEGLGAYGSGTERLNVYRLVPIAKADDPRWDNSPGSGEVVVAARTSGDARIVAEGRELDFMEVDAAPAEGVTTVHASAFRDDKLYTVIEIDRDRDDLKRGVLEGHISVDTIKPTQL